MAVNQRETVKIVVEGARRTGKTCILMTYLQQTFPTDFLPTLWDNTSLTVNYGNEDLNLHLADSASTGDGAIYMRLRWCLGWVNTNVFLLVFSVDDPTSLTKITEEYVPQMRENIPKAHIILVCAKTDLRTDPKTIDDLQRLHQRRPIDYDEGKKIADSIGASAYMEVCSMRLEGLKELFEEAARLSKVKAPSQVPKGRCEIL